MHLPLPGYEEEPTIENFFLGNSHIVFVIGGSLGLSDAVRKKQTIHYVFLR